MTSVFFVRHAQPDQTCRDDRTRPLTLVGLKDSLLVTEALVNVRIDMFYSSPYKRSMDTIAERKSQKCYKKCPPIAGMKPARPA